MAQILYRKLDENGDYSGGFGLQNFYTDLEAVTQAILTKIKLLQGEWWENTDEGLPLFQQILGRFGSANDIKNLTDQLIQQRIMDTPYVINVQIYESEYTQATRSYQATATVNTQFGTTIININNLLPT